MGAGWNGIIFDDLEWPLTRVSRSLYSYKLNISKRCVLGTKLLKNTNRKPHVRSTEWCHIPWSWVTSDPDFKVARFLDIEYLRNDTRQSQSYYRTSLGSQVHSIKRWHFQWPWRTPNPVFKATVFLKSNISKRCILGTKLLKNTNRKPYRVYRMITLSMTLSDLWPRFQGHIFDIEYLRNDR